MSVTLGELAVRFGCELRGDPHCEIDSVATLADAHPRAVSFLAESRHRAALLHTRAAAVVLEARFAAQCPVATLITSNPRATYARIATVLHPAAPVVAGIHPSALVAADARVDPSAHVGALALIGARAEVGAGAMIGPHCVLGSDVMVAQQVRLVARVTLCDGVTVGARSIVHPGAVIGSDGFGFAPERGTWLKVPQIGSVRIGADVEIGANTTIDRGAIGDTVIADGVKLDNLIQIGHNVRLGAHTAIAGCTGVSGSTVIGERCQIGGACAIGGHLLIADDVIITGFSMISHSIPKPGVYSSGIPFEEARTWRRMVARFKRLDRDAPQQEGRENEDD
ncbi:MAG TPA: UDP-3-O-(3-hydroxymyristoyl)glucosamine N-acyltransferase [Steroidobacteraceae bacterium]|jgi:UDP-3-O-[3-hydroxymyristoyl] glucosamine N-acyltransferase|nr:UDP-3-O-(3-hydroxymyristoyl)glucosamine N-acyltransferase [Steroidobacteraceae bacterium]